MDWTTRYATELNNIFGGENKVALQVRVETALLGALAKEGIAPAEAHAEAVAAMDSGSVTWQRVKEIEKETHHDVMAMVKALAEQMPNHGGWVHYGATSQDINDTVLGLQLGAAQRMLVDELAKVRAQLTRLAKTYRDTACIGRTHGQHAVPTTMGFKFANFLHEVTLASSFVERVQISIGKFSGAVGTFASLGTRAVQAHMLAALELSAVPIATQVISRLYIADFTFALGAAASALERLAKEVRNLQRTEINELAEGFAKTQVGSSTMPQKRNPHKCERVCGIARVVRAQLAPALETVSLEHERDLTNSSLERIALSTAAVLLHYITREMAKILTTLHVDEAAAARNLNLKGGSQLAERVMMALAGKMGRQEAHELLRVHAGFVDFAARVRGDERVRSHLSDADLDALFDASTYTGCAGEVVDAVVASSGVDASE